MATLEGYRLVVPICARFRDSDAMGHVNNAVYLTYFEEARAAYFREVVDLQDYRDVAIILAQARCDFRSPLYAGEQLDVGVKIGFLILRVFRVEGIAFQIAPRRVFPTIDGERIERHPDVSNSGPVSRPRA